MRKIQVQVIITSIRSRRDGSLGFSAETPELTDEEKVEFMRLQNNVLETTFVPLDTPDVPEVKINKDLEEKSQSQRLRSALYILHQQTGKGDFETFYREKMETFINKVKSHLD